MRTVLFYLAIISLAGFGIKLWMNLDETDPYEIPYLSSNSNFGFSFFETNSEYEPEVKKIEPSAKWDSILVGSWNFTGRYYHVKTLGEMKGDITFSNDGTFDKKLNYTYYDTGDGRKRVEKRDKYIEYNGGARVRGKWVVNVEEHYWKEAITSCNERSTYNSSSFNKICDLYQDDYYNFYGYIPSDFGDFEIIALNSREIHIEAKRFDSGGLISYYFTRIEG